MKEMKKFKIKKTSLLLQIAMIIISPFQIYSDGSKKGVFKSEGFFKASLNDLFSLLNINITYNKKEILCKKNLGLDYNNVQEEEVWLKKIFRNVSDIENIVLEAEKDSLPDFWDESHENALFIPRFVFIKMKNGEKICIAGIYKMKLAQKVVAQLKKDILGEEIEYYETTTNFVDKYNASTVAEKHDEPDSLKLFFLRLHHFWKILYIIVPILMYYLAYSLMTGQIKIFNYSSW